MTVIVDYGVGNIFSLRSSFGALGEEAAVTSCPQTVRQAGRIVLPGVGAFADAAKQLKRTGLAGAVAEAALSGTPVLGICLGMQLLFERSFENGVHQGLGLIGGSVRPIRESAAEGLKIPQIGWNRLILSQPVHPLFRFLKESEYVYFVHSYHAVCPERFITAKTEYGGLLTAAAAKGNVMGCQFHPEKSGPAGLRILKAFCMMQRGDFVC